MEPDHQPPHQTEYADSQWVDMGGYGSAAGQHAATSMHEYGGFGFAASPVVPIEPAFPRPPPYNSHQPLPHLITVAPWPSMLTSTSFSAPVIPTAPLMTPVSASTATPTVTPVTTTGGSTPRRTLTDDDRRRMCEYHESHPGVKQTEIGGEPPSRLPPPPPPWRGSAAPAADHTPPFAAMFGVERR